MNLYQARLMDKPSLDTAPYCSLCHRWVGDRIERHHIVKRSQGGTNGPTVTVCGHGNIDGCHGLLEVHKLHLDWNDEGYWEYILLKEPMKFEKARQMPGWRKVRNADL